MNTTFLIKTLAALAWSAPLVCAEGSPEAFTLPAPDQINETDAWHRTPLMQAVRRGSAEEVKALLDAGAGVNAASVLGRTALMMAADSQQPEMVELLLGAGADVQARDLQGNTALMLAQTEGDGYLSLPCPTLQGKDAVTRCTQLLLAAGADAEACNAAGQNALMAACYRRMASPDA